jgi:hypothetical protein
MIPLFPIIKTKAGAEYLRLKVSCDYRWGREEGGILPTPDVQTYELEIPSCAEKKRPPSWTEPLLFQLKSNVPIFYE